MATKFNEILDTLAQIKGLLSGPHSTTLLNSSQPSELSEVLEIAIEEQRKVYDELCDTYQHLKIKILTFFGGGLALLTFLYSGKTGKPPRADLFIPHEVSGRIFYFTGLALVISALVLLFIALRPKTWEVPTEVADLKKLEHDSQLDYLKYVRDRYVICWDIDSKIIQDKQRKLDFAFNMLVFGGIILVVLNIFGG